MMQTGRHKTPSARLTRSTPPTKIAQLNHPLIPASRAAAAKETRRSRTSPRRPAPRRGIRAAAFIRAKHLYRDHSRPPPTPERISARPYRAATGEESRSQQLFTFPRRSFPLRVPDVHKIKSVCRSGAAEPRESPWGERIGAGRGGPKPTPRLKPGPRQVAQDAKVSSARKVLNIQYSRRGTSATPPVRGGGACGYRSNFIFPILFRAQRRIRRCAGEAQPTESRGESRG